MKVGKRTLEDALKVVVYPPRLRTGSFSRAKSKMLSADWPGVYAMLEPARREPGVARAAISIKRLAAKASVLFRSSEKRAKGRVPPSGLGACAVADVVVTGAT